MAAGTVAVKTPVAHTSSRDTAYAFSTTAKPETLFEISLPVEVVEFMPSATRVDEIPLSASDMALFAEVLENPPLPNARLAGLFRHHEQDRNA